MWLSHHHPAEHHRTYALGRVRLCARCVGTYPTLLLCIALMFAARAPLEHRADAFVTLGLLLPALVDWAYGRFRPHAGSNAWRSFTGVLLGVALGRTLYVHVQRPYPSWLLLQALLVTAVALPVILVAYRRPHRE